MTGGNFWAHRRPAFLPWHREYLRRYELALQAHRSQRLPCRTGTGRSTTRRRSSIWDADFMGGDGTGASDEVETGPFAQRTGNWTLTMGSASFLRREFGSTWQICRRRDQVSDCLDETPYDEFPLEQLRHAASFRNRLEGWFGFGLDPQPGAPLGRRVDAAGSPRRTTRCSGCTTATSTGCGRSGNGEHPAEPYHPQGRRGHRTCGPQPERLDAAVGRHRHGGEHARPPRNGLSGMTPTRRRSRWSRPRSSFPDVPEGSAAPARTTYRAVVFEVRSCASA